MIRPDRDVRQELLEWHVQQRRVQKAHGGGLDAGGDRDPERTDHRPAVALFDVLPAEAEPQLTLIQTVAKVFERTTERLGVGHGRRCVRRLGFDCGC